MQQTESSLSIELRGAVLLLARRIRQERSDEAITPSELSVLGVLDHHGAVTPSRLAEHEQISPPSMTRTLTNLAAKQYVAKASDPTDGRQVLIELTAAGKKIVGDTRNQRSAWLSQRLAALEPEERAVMVEAARIMRSMNTPQ